MNSNNKSSFYLLLIIAIIWNLYVLFRFLAFFNIVPFYDPPFAGKSWWLMLSMLLLFSSFGVLLIVSCVAAYFTCFSSKTNGSEIIENNIWSSKAKKYKGISNEIATEIAIPKGPQKILVVAHFEDCLEQLQLALGEVVEDRVQIILASDLTRIGDLSNSNNPMLLLIAERHPYHLHDDLVLQFSQNQPHPCRIHYHVSLEDFLLKPFTSKRTKKTLQMLGMEDNEPIKSKMVDYRLHKELKRIAKRIRSDLPVRSAEEWYVENIEHYGFCKK